MTSMSLYIIWCTSLPLLHPARKQRTLAATSVLNPQTRRGSNFPSLYLFTFILSVIFGVFFRYYFFSHFYYTILLHLFIHLSIFLFLPKKRPPICPNKPRKKGWYGVYTTPDVAILLLFVQEIIYAKLSSGLELVFYYFLNFQSFVL